MHRLTLIGIGSAIIVGLAAAACGGGETATPTARPAATATTAPARPTATAVGTTVARPSPTPAPTVAQATATPAARPTSAPAAPAGRLRMAIPTFDNEQVRPSHGKAATLSGYMGGLYDWLVWAGTDGSLAPGIATRWDFASDALSWTYTVRQGMRFHNGDPLTADDVKFSIEKLLQDNSDAQHATFSASWVAQIQSVDIVSPTAVRVNLKKPWPLMAMDASVLTGTEGAVAPKAYMQQVGDNGFDEKPIGSGPWRFLRHDLGVRFLFEAVPTAHAYRQTPKFKELEILAVPEESTRVAMLRTKAVDLAALGSFDTAAGLMSNPEFSVLAIQGGTIGSMLLWGADDARIKDLPLAKKPVREALALALNVPEIVETIFRGLAKVANDSFITPSGMGYDPSWKPQEFNPNRAKELLTQAGYARGFSFRVYSFSTAAVPWAPRVAEASAGYWSQIGLRPEIIPVDSVAGFYRARPQGIDLMGQASPLWVTASPSPLGPMRSQVHSKGTLLLLQRPEMDALLDQAVAELDEQKRIQLLRGISEMARSEYVVIPIVVSPALVGAGSNIAGWQAIPAAGVSLALETVTPK
ncbi:MAG: ABC transporter substrate-binding protein [Chloroflexi bacterium]|nr:ABC transporter substrate-binding protein [Chloroflexota bacterium]